MEDEVGDGAKRDGEEMGWDGRERGGVGKVRDRRIILT